MGSTLEEVQAAKGGSRVICFAGLRSYVVNFEASNPWPSKFTYRGCGVLVGKKWTCSRSVERSNCDHDLEGEYTSHFFRFDVFLTDGSGGGRPFKATIFGAAAHLLGISVNKFWHFKEAEQVNHVQEVIHGTMPLCELSLKSGNGEVVIQSLSFVTVAPSPRKGLGRRGSDFGEASSRESLFTTPTGSFRTSGPEGTPTSTSTDSGKESMTLVKAVKFISKKFLDLAASDEE